MAAVYSHDLPTALPAAPSSSTSTRGGTRKRTSSPQQTDEEAAEPVQPKAKRVRSTQQEKNAKKVARMERNRVAAQVSRDRKKQQTEYLAQRVAELEAQLVSGPSPAASISASFSTISPSPTFALPALPLPPPTPAADPLLVGQLKEENESLKKQLALEKLASQALQIRLSSLEAKFGRLEQLLSGGFGADVKPAVVKVKQEEQEKTNVEQGAKESHSLLPVSTRGRPVPAAEAVPPVLDHDHQHHLSNNNLDHLPSPFDFSLPPASSSGLQLDLNFDLVPAVAAPDSLLDQGALPAVPEVTQDDLAQAWANWANQLDPSAFVHEQQPVEQQAGEDFDLFEFLRQDVAAGSAQVEVGC
ncbi:hypothetical protein JCM11251_002648 [Rhodosporidiobolus azoricus]